MTKICVICGAEFSAPPSSKKITCSKKCSSIQKSKTHMGISNSWSPTSKKLLSQRVQAENLKKGTEAARLSPKSGAFETNINAKTWSLRSPSRVIYNFTNLNKFCRDHEDFFDCDYLTASSGIRAILRKKGHAPSHYKGWEILSVYKKTTNNEETKK